MGCRLAIRIRQPRIPLNSRPGHPPSRRPRVLQRGPRAYRRLSHPSQISQAADTRRTRRSCPTAVMKDSTPKSGCSSGAPTGSTPPKPPSLSSSSPVGPLPSNSHTTQEITHIQGNTDVLWERARRRVYGVNLVTLHLVVPCCRSFLAERPNTCHTAGIEPGTASSSPAKSGITLFSECQRRKLIQRHTATLDDHHKFDDHQFATEFEPHRHGAPLAPAPR